MWPQLFGTTSVNNPQSVPCSEVVFHGHYLRPGAHNAFYSILSYSILFYSHIYMYTAPLAVKPNQRRPPVR